MSAATDIPVPPVAGLELVVGVAAPPALAARLRTVLERDGTIVVAAASDPVDLAFRFLDDRQPHVAVISAGPALQHSLRMLARVMPSTRTVVLVRDRSVAQVDAALKLGCDAAVLESEAPMVLPTTVRSVVLGQSSVPREIRAILRDQLPLTRREHQLLCDAVDALSVAETAVRHGVSARAVRQQGASALAKLKTDSIDAASRDGAAPGRGRTSTAGQSTRSSHGGRT
ncbi:MAG TPA: hypothetical protein VLA98_10660 [Solirubrobacteraceae bacterium]|nr:hypothetical protein [Solirubrobacteraceae bacterium]HSD81112.1 hypothetical protein [Solirubrobacteraceae bacterium]